MLTTSFDEYEAMRRIEWEEEEKAQTEYYKKITEEERRGCDRKTVAELIEERSLAEEKERERSKAKKQEEEDTKSKEEKKDENYEETNNSKKGLSPEDGDKEEPEMKGEGAPNPVDSFNPRSMI